MFNDVATTRTGFIASVPQVPKPGEKTATPDILSGVDTGSLFEWTRQKGLRPIPGTVAPYNNGVQVSPDGRYVYYAAWTGKQVRRFDRTTGKTVSVPVDFYPDNISVRADGMMVVAGAARIDGWMDCFKAADEFCPAGFGVATLDPRSMAVKPLYSAGPGLMPGASVGLQIGRDLYIGSFTGNRVLRVRLDR
jgi:hypothetical protein